MKIETKYNIGDRVWIVYEERGEVCVYDTVIENIDYGKDGLSYMTTEYNDYNEDALIPYNEKEKLLERIESIMKEIHEREKGTDKIE